MNTTQQAEALPALIERFRGLHFDHAPDGWPAVRTREITALLDRITELESQLAQRFDAADMATASAQGDALDAVRYRFLRDGEWRDTDLEPFIRLQLNTLWDAKIDAARAAQGFMDGVAKGQQARWQPIETAPANGQCLVWCDTDDGGEVMKLCRDKEGNWLYEGEPTYATSFYIEPTHWRELPPPPSSAQREVGNANS